MTGYYDIMTFRKWCTTNLTIFRRRINTINVIDVLLSEQNLQWMHFTISLRGIFHFESLWRYLHSTEATMITFDDVSPKHVIQRPVSSRIWIIGTFDESTTHFDLLWMSLTIFGRNKRSTERLWPHFVATK